MASTRSSKRLGWSTTSHLPVESGLDFLVQTSFDSSRIMPKKVHILVKDKVDFVAYMTGDCRLSASFEDVKQFTSTASSFDIELSVGGCDHRLIFRTTQGKEIGICMKDAIMHHCKELAKKKSGADEVPLDESRLPFTSVNKTQGGGATSETASVEGLDCGNVWY